jgi:DNA replication protein
MRRLAPELLSPPRPSAGHPEELLRTLVEAEISARDASNARTRLKNAAFPVTKTLDEFDLGVSSVPPATFAYLASLEWITAAENLCLVGPAGTARATCWSRSARRRRGRAQGPLLHRRRARRDPLPGPGRQQRRPGHRHPAPQRPHPDRRVGFAPLDDTGAQLLFRVVAAAYERRALGIASHWPFESWGRFLPEHTTAVSLLDRLLHHASVVVTDGDSYRMRQARARRNHPEQDLINPRGGDF